jgi:hypothetical protein
MIYNCEPCKYTSSRQTNYIRHNASQKHKILNSSKHLVNVDKDIEIANESNNIADSKLKFTELELVDSVKNKDFQEKVLQCTKCKTIFLHHSSLSRHRKKNCVRLITNSVSKNDLDKNNISKIDVDEKNNINKTLIGEINELKMELKKRDAEKIAELQEALRKKDDEMKKKDEEMRKKDEDAKNEINYFKSLVTNAGAIVKTTNKTNNTIATAMTHIVKNYPNAPTLGSLKLMDYKTISLENHDLTTTLASYYKDGLLPKYLSDILVKYYVEADPKNQSFWASDVSRLTFVARIESENENEDPQWVYDMKGKLVGKSIIDPMLKNTKIELLEYINDTPAKIKKLSVADGEKITDVQKTAYKLLDDINSGKLKKQLLKEMSPYFYFYDTKKIEQ